MENLKILSVFLALIVCSVGAQETMCGQPEPDHEKTCISIRLPWQETPLYFCTDKENLPYKDRCHDRYRYCRSQTSNATLLIATPWDCCALESVPDYCSGRKCPAAPYNRTCQEIATDPKKPWNCCPNYFCEEGPVNQCQLKRLHPSCNAPPKNKTNCVGFKDPHGCCTKFQCDSEGKPGFCPMELQAKKFQNLIRRHRNGVFSTTAKSLLESDGASSGQTNRRHHHIHPVFSGVKTELRCVGDYNCPGDMKCCSNSMSTYLDTEDIHKMGNSHYGYNLRQPKTSVYGYCVEPIRPHHHHHQKDEEEVDDETEVAQDDVKDDQPEE